MSQSWINKNKEKIKIKFGKWDIIINNEFKLIQLNDWKKMLKKIWILKILFYALLIIYLKIKNRINKFNYFIINIFIAL